MEPPDEKQIRHPWTVWHFFTYITAGFVWFHVVVTDSIPLYWPWSPDPYGWLSVPLRLNWSTKRPFTRQGWGWLRGIWTMCRLVWVFRPSYTAYVQYNDRRTIRIFALPISGMPQHIWFRFRVQGSTGWVNTSTPIFQLIIPTCPPPGASGLTLIAGPPPPIAGDGNATITLTPSYI